MENFSVGIVGIFGAALAIDMSRSIADKQSATRAALFNEVVRSSRLR
jgi:hypothetical protein